MTTIHIKNSEVWEAWLAQFNDSHDYPVLVVDANGRRWLTAANMSTDGIKHIPSRTLKTPLKVYEVN